MFRITAFRMISIALLLFTVSCTSGKEQVKDDKTDKEVVEETTKKEREMTPEEIAECPCGRPDWDELPPGFSTGQEPK